MASDFTAFTTKANGKLSELASMVKITPAKEIYSSGGKLPEVNIKAIWDTGATGTCVSSKVVEDLNLIPISKRPIRSVNKESIANVYLIDIYLPNRV